MKKNVKLLSVEALTDFECLVKMNIDGYIIDKVIVVADIEEIRTIMNSGNQQNTYMDIYFDTYRAFPIEERLMDFKSDMIIGRVERIVTDEEIVLNCGFVVEVNIQKRYLMNINPGDYLMIQGHFSGIQYEE